MKQHMTALIPVFAAKGKDFDARAFVRKNGGNWKIRRDDNSKNTIVYCFEPELMSLSNDRQIEVAMQFLEEMRPQIIELRQQTEVMQLCVQTNHSFTGYQSGAGILFTVELMTMLCDLGVELIACVGVQCDSSF